MDPHGGQQSGKILDQEREALGDGNFLADLVGLGESFLTLDKIGRCIFGQIRPDQRRKFDLWNGCRCDGGSGLDYGRNIKLLRAPESPVFVFEVRMDWEFHEFQVAVAINDDAFQNPIRVWLFEHLLAGLEEVVGGNQPGVQVLLQLGFARGVNGPASPRIQSV